MTTFHIIYKPAARNLQLPETIEADSYFESGRFFRFALEPQLDVREVVATLASDLVAYIAQDDDEDGADGGA